MDIGRAVKLFYYHIFSSEFSNVIDNLQRIPTVIVPVEHDALATLFIVLLVRVEAVHRLLCVK